MTQDNTDVLQMRALGVTQNQDVIEQYQDEHLDDTMEDVVHEGLECRRRVGEAERHDQELKMAVVRAELSLLHIGRLHKNLVVLATEVEHGEEVGSTELVEEFIHHGDWEHVADHFGIECT
jgi:hypothetical protein